MSWKNNSQRHSLASRGIKTRVYSEYPQHLDKIIITKDTDWEDEKEFNKAVKEYLKYYPIKGYDWHGIQDLAGGWWWGTPDDDYNIIATPFYEMDKGMFITLSTPGDWDLLDEIEFETDKLTPRNYVELMRYWLENNDIYIEDELGNEVLLPSPGFVIAQEEMKKIQKEKGGPCILCGKGFKREWMEGNKRVLLFDRMEDAQGLINQLRGSNTKWRGGYVGGGYTLEIMEE